MVEEFFLRRRKDLWPNVIPRMTLEGTDTNVCYEELLLPHTAHAVHRVSQLTILPWDLYTPRPVTYQV